MKKNSARPAECIERIMDTYGNLLFRLCLFTLGNADDAEDVVQETFIKYMQYAPDFKDENHEKAWLITVASNKSKDLLRFRKRHLTADIGNLSEYVPDNSNPEIIDALLSLPEKYRTVLILYYVEEFNVNEIAQIIDRSSSAVKMRLQKGRKLLKEAYRKELMSQVNLQMPVYSKLSDVEKMDSPFEKTPKMSIKRFLYS